MCVLASPLSHIDLNPHPFSFLGAHAAQTPLYHTHSGSPVGRASLRLRFGRWLLAFAPRSLGAGYARAPPPASLRFAGCAALIAALRLPPAATCLGSVRLSLSGAPLVRRGLPRPRDPRGSLCSQTSRPRPLPPDASFRRVCFDGRSLLSSVLPLDGSKVAISRHTLVLPCALPRRMLPLVAIVWGERTIYARTDNDALVGSGSDCSYQDPQRTQAHYAAPATAGEIGHSAGYAGALAARTPRDGGSPAPVNPRALRTKTLAPPPWLALLRFTCGGFASGFASGATALPDVRPCVQPSLRSGVGLPLCPTAGLRGVESSLPLASIVRGVYVFPHCRAF